jgi:plastocyanin
MAPANWTLTPDQGTVAFNSTTPPNELSFTGPTGNLSPSFDQASITTHFSGLMYVSFAWSFNVEGATGGSLEIEVGGANPIVYSGGAGYTAGYSASAPDVLAVEPGDTITFLMTSDPTSASGKSAPAFDVSDFSIVVPEANATPWVESFLLLPICGRLAWAVCRRKCKV